ncbi:two-component system sensor histidine kinase/response regulator [Chitiniphilus shinanonensis]|uniref:histidine kinase n=1 Tax=Chitiniphilus shinanonensis TaxID=553088 RepID=A0ABQ6BU19_9NEIS|nr:response regulator [Chitiniphilus shinanonensis]GLS05271.1 two-component system sensor histidine kinase/response regulator [Chitiniphilus shinanonensis]
MTHKPIDDLDADVFRKMLSRNVLLPLGVALASAAVFVALLFYLVSVMRTVDQSNRVIGKSHEMTKLLIDAETGMRGFLLTGQRNFLEPYQTASTRIPFELTALKERVVDNPEHLKRIASVSALYSRWRGFVDQAIVLKDNSGNVIELISSERGKQLMDAMRAEMAAVISTEEALRSERSRAANETITVLVSLTVALMLLTGGGLAYNGRRQLLSLSETYSGALARQQRQTEQLGRQAWIKTGQTELAMRLLGQQSVEKLCGNALAFLAEYLGARVGALYIGEDDQLYRRQAGYALDAEVAARRDTLRPGEGLTGQAVAERRVIRLDDLPAGYLPVTSALGATPPRHLLIVPIVHEEGAIGVAEFGFLASPDDDTLEFSRLAMETLGAAIRAAQYRERLRLTLEETQQLNEELQTQQEELKTANEELEEQSRALRETQARLENQQAELERSNEQLEEQSLRLQQQKDFLNERNSALNEAHRLLEDRARELQRASQYKSEFLANMSHELRTPLNSALIFAKLLGDNPAGNLTDEQVRFANMIHAAGSDLLNLINDILDLSKVEAGMLDIYAEPVPLKRVCQSMQTLFDNTAADKGVAFACELDPTLPATVETDTRRLEQILKNLLSNAFKFTHEGQVRLRIASHPDGVGFAVEDSGIGIAPEQQDVIFEAFRQADGTTNRKYGGTGLGLSISRDLARLLGGRLEVASAPGVGSTFTLVLPLALPQQGEAPLAEASPAPQPVARPPMTAPVPAPAVAEEAPAPSSVPDDRAALPAHGRVMLVIEDDERFASILYQLAHERQFACLIAGTAAEGVALARQYVPDAILLDLKLPDQSGMAVLEKLKEDARTRHIPTHIVSSVDRSDAALYMGAVGYLLKPAEHAQLQGVFERLERKLAQKIKHVLLVEDDAMQRESIARLIADTDVEITGVASAEEALQQLRDRVFDCMVIDLTLPDMHGAELLERMAGDHLYSFPPVIVYTGRTLSRDEEAALRRYSHSIIIKGARSPERLLDEVTLFLHQVETELPPERQKMLKAARNRDRAFEGSTILVVDDDVRNIFALTSALEMKGAQVAVARNGREALNRLDERGDIDLVLMDIMMPEMDGYQAMTEIRRQPRFKDLPIIAVTAKAMKDDQERCIEAGANDYLAKPIDLDALVSLVRVWISKPGRA